MEEVPLTGGNLSAGVVRVGTTVRRPTGPWTPAVHALLRHLEQVGFDAAPRVLGIDERDREILTYIPGEPLVDLPAKLASTEVVEKAGALAASYHAAATTFTPPPDATWWPGTANRTQGSIVMHGDLAPWNVIVDGDRWSLIDWDTASPGERSWELAYSLHCFVGMWPDQGHTDARVVTRAQAFAAGYGLATSELVEIVELVPGRVQSIAAMIEHHAAAGHPAFERMLAEGHREAWLRAADHTTARLPTWVSVLERRR